MSEEQRNEAVSDPIDDPLDETDVASMEDILASIRSMIAEDTATPPAPAPVAPVEAEFTADPEDSLEALLEPLDLAQPGIPEPSPPSPPIVEAVPTAPMPASESDVSPVANATVPDTAPASDDLGDLDLESLFEPLDMADLPVEMPVTSAVQEPSDTDIADVLAEPAALSGSEDMDLVKSLMADLTDADLSDADLGELAASEAASEAEDATPDADMPDEVEAPVSEAIAEDAAASDALADLEELELSEDWFAEDLSIPEIEPAPAAAPVQNEQETVLSDILDRALEDEERLSGDAEADVADPVAVTEDVPEEAEPEIAPTLPVAVAGVATAATVVSLADIAAAADAEAEALDGAAVEDVAEADAEPVELIEEPELDIEDDFQAVEAEPESEPEPEPEPNQTTEDGVIADDDLSQALEDEVMARTAPLEEILDEEVETDTTSAFAELNRLVEEKQVFEERGPRIGDLVQEALKPMLKEWLDENLKGIVERAVQKEVKRIASGK